MLRWRADDTKASDSLVDFHTVSTRRPRRDLVLVLGHGAAAGRWGLWAGLMGRQPLHGLMSCAMGGAGSGGLRSNAEAAVVEALPLV